MAKGFEFFRQLAMGRGLTDMAAADVAVDPAPRVVGGGPDPWHLHLLAWEYLLPNRRMTRRVDRLEVHSTRWGMKTMELDVSFPSSCLTQNGDPDGPPERCLIPAALIPKQPVAVDLEVRNADGGWVSVPTRRECKLVTEQAVGLIQRFAHGLTGSSQADFDLSSELRQRIGDVITMDPLHARVSRLHIQERMNLREETKDWLLPLLRRLEDNYMLWVPIEGSPLGDHHLSIQRSDHRQGEQLFWPARLFRETVVVESTAGTIYGHWKPPLRWLYVPSPSSIFSRLLASFGLMPIKFDEETLEAHRFASYHLAMVPPRGLVVREVKTGEISETEWQKTKPVPHELLTDLDRTVQGEDTRTGHVHLEMDRNPGWLNSRFTIGLRPGTTTLWAMVVVLTCGLLWALRHELQRILGITHSEEALEAQIVAAVLLVGPTFAASWSLRGNQTLIRSMVVGAQGLLLGSAVISVAAALVLAGFKPFGWGPERTIDWYASLSYAVAVLITTGWIQARSLIWLVYRRILSNTTMNMLATGIFAGIGFFAARDLESIPIAPAAVLAAAGFALTAVAGNRVSVSLGQNSRLAAFWTGLGALICLALAGRDLDFFDRLATNEADAFHYGELALALVAGVALVVFSVQLARELVRIWRKWQGSAAQPPRQLAGESQDPAAETT